jgi:ABC-2 type transport system permease protein
MSETRLLQWSIRRELWENRAVFIAPLVVAGVALIGFCFSMVGLPERRRAVLLLDEVKQRAAIAMVYDVVASILVATAFIVGALYCIDALHSERRDRSILFWKSLPLSDRTVVLSKLGIPLAVLPAVTFTIIVATQAVMLLLMSGVLVFNGLDPLVTWKYYNLFEQGLIHIYGLVVVALWHAPVYAWLLLVSAWARRATFLWAVLPFLALGVFERITNSGRFIGWVKYRLMDGAERAFDFSKGMSGTLEDLTPARFFSQPGLWGGLIVAAAFVAVAIRLRHLREPI